MKKKITAVVLIILMLVPSMIAVWNYVSLKNGPVDSRNVISLTIDDLTGQQFVLERSNDKGMEVIDFFLDMNKNALSITALPDALSGSPFFKVTVKSAAKESAYKYYFAADSTEGYYVDDSGKAFRIGESHVTKFITGEYAASLYSQSHVPTLTLSAAHKVAPSFAHWQYENYEGKFVAAGTDYLLASGDQSFTVEGGLSLEFDNKPDFFSVKITDVSTGKEIYNDLYENISSLTLTDSANLSFEAQAKWYEDSTRNYYGELTYKFGASLAAPAAFYMGVESATVGEFVTVTGVNVSNKDNVKFSCEPDIGYTPVFYQDGGSVRTLIPLAYNLEGGKYKFTFSYAGLTQDISLNVEGKTFGTSIFTTSSANASKYLADSSVNAFKEVISSAAAKASSERYWEGAFFQGCNGDLTIGFGRFFKISASGQTFRHDGVMYKGGTTVSAVNAGVVVYAGVTEFGGNTVIIEHGYGLQSIYTHMADGLSVKVGDKVKKGDTIGKCGSTGFVPDDYTGADVGLMVNGVPVCAYPLWEDGAWKGIPMMSEGGN